MARPTHTDAVLFVRELRLQLDNPECGIELNHRDLVMLFMVIDSLIPDEEHDD